MTSASVPSADRNDVSDLAPPARSRTAPMITKNIGIAQTTPRRVWPAYACPSPGKRNDRNAARTGDLLRIRPLTLLLWRAGIALLLRCRRWLWLTEDVRHEILDALHAAQRGDVRRGEVLLVEAVGIDA